MYQEGLSAAEAAAIAAREAASPGLETFEGGLATGVLWAGIIVLCFVIVAVYFLIIEPRRFGGR